MEYYIVFIFLAIFSLMEVYGLKEKQKKYLLCLGFLLVWGLQALRWETGTDWGSYSYFFETAGTRSFFTNSEFEWGYTLLNYIVYQINNSYTAFLIIFCGLWVFLIYKFAETFTPCYSLVLLFFFSATIFPIRFSLATAIIYISYNAIIRKEFGKFLICILIATLIHRTAIVFLPVYFVARRKYPAYFLIIFYIIAFIVGADTDSIFNTALKYAALIFSDVGDTLQNKMTFYLNEEVPERSQLSSFRVLLSFLNSSIFIILFYFFRYRRFRDSNEYNTILNLYMFGLIFNRIFWLSIPDFARITVYFQGAFIFLIIKILSLYRKNTQMILALLLILYCFSKLIENLFGYYSTLFLPYISIFSEMKRVVYDGI